MNFYDEKPKKRPVSSSAVARIVIWSVVLCILLGVFGCWMVFGTGGFPVGIGVGGYDYENAHTYSVGNATVTEAIRSLDIDWLDGTVTVIPTDGDAVTVTESYDGSEENEKLRWKLENGRLTVKYMAPRRAGLFAFGGDNALGKDLEVAIPVALLENLANVDLTLISADLILRVPTDELDVEMVSGRMTLEGDYDEIDVETVSGELAFRGAAREISVDGVSATLELDMTKPPESISVDTVSGDVTVILPDSTTGFELSRDSLGGFLEVSGFVFDSVTEGQLWGDGSVKIDVDGVSSKLTVKKSTKD